MKVSRLASAPAVGLMPFSTQARGDVAERVSRLVDPDIACAPRRRGASAVLACVGWRGRVRSAERLAEVHAVTEACVPFLP